MATISSSRPSNGLAEKPDTSSSHQYTCNTCQVAFRFADTQKSHMKSDWHRYNLKRRVASLPPISSEVFTEKVLQARAATTAEADKAGFQQLCEVCQKNFFSENSYRNHLGSQKHKAREMAMQRKGPSVNGDDASSVMSSTFSLGEPLPVEKDDVDSDAEDEFSEVVENLKKTKLNERSVDERPSPVKRPSNPQPSDQAQRERHRVSENADDAASTAATPVPTVTLKSCLFCNYESPSVPLNVTHMERIHGCFIPEKEYLVNLEGLIENLQERIHELCECLYCGKMRSNAFAVQTHMRDKGHCKIPYTTEDEQLEIGEFYDFRSTYSDDEASDDESVDGDKQPGGVKLGARRSAKAVGEDGDEITETEEGWETDSSESSCDSDEITSVPIEGHLQQYARLDKHPHHSSTDPRAHHQPDGWHSHAHKHRAIFHDDTSLHLPSGRAVGHRSLQKYYRQNLHSYPTPEERAERLALEGSTVEPGEPSGDNQVAHQERGRSSAVIPRDQGGIGMVGVTDEKRKEVKRAEKRARKVEHNAARRQEWNVNKKGNQQKYYNYQIL
ncbi:c2h2 type zinc finger containing protein [Apiospora phragmitis]|uniref:C2h2 type zinc finger containing protein n=1 Tax=Apiospora phragmitis TaxID=2905665 RepID=A0ABR1VET5_9PEZI